MTKTLNCWSTLFQKASAFSLFSFEYLRHLLLSWFHSLGQLCHVGLYCVIHYIVVLWQLDLCLLIFFAALLQWCVGSPEHISSGLRPFFLKSFLVFQTVPFIFHFLMFLIVEMGSNHWESCCSLLLLCGNEPSSFWNPWKPMVVNTRQNNRCSWTN